MSPSVLFRLVRLPALPSALADVAMGAIACGALASSRPSSWWGAFAAMLGASACIYTSGMAFNDVFDADEDARERPERPIPSGHISRNAAFRVAAALMAAGVGLASLSGFLLTQAEVLSSPLIPHVLAGSLCVAVLAYDARLKHTAAGPVAMGACRFLNVLLGVTLAGWPNVNLGLHLASVVGLYIVGVTWFARTESATSSKSALTAAATVMFAALALALPLPTHKPPDTASVAFPYLLVATGLLLALPVTRAIDDPSPRIVQNGVRRSLMLLIALDAALATATGGTWGVVILALMLPSLWLNTRKRMSAT